MIQFNHVATEKHGERGRPTREKGYAPWINAGPVSFSVMGFMPGNGIVRPSEEGERPLGYFPFIHSGPIPVGLIFGQPFFLKHDEDAIRPSYIPRVHTPTPVSIDPTCYGFKVVPKHKEERLKLNQWNLFKMPPSRPVTYEQVGIGTFRIAVDSFAGYDLYLGTNSPPTDFTSPWASFAGTSYVTPALNSPPSGSRTYYIVMRRRNKYNLQSLHEWNESDPFSFKVTINASGDQQPQPPSDPINMTLTAGPSGTFYLYAEYFYELDSSDIRADAFLIYLRTDGTNPDPSVDTPVEIEMNQVDGVAKLNPPDGYQTAPFSEGTIGKALIRTRRNGSPDVDSVNVYDGLTATATLMGPAARPGTGAFFDDSHRQGDND